MKTQHEKSSVPKKVGRPATGQDAFIGLRVSADMLMMIDAWAAAQQDRPKRSEAMRRLIRAGLRRSPE